MLHRLEERVKTEPSSGAYWILALTCRNRAIPPDLGTEAKKRRFLTYNGLDSDAGLPKHVDQELVAKTIRRYFKKAIEFTTEDQSRNSKDANLAESDRWQQNFYSRQLVDFYASLDRHADALELCTSLAQRKRILSRRRFLLTYGESLFSAGKLDDEPKNGSVQEGSLPRPRGIRARPGFHATVAAKTTLGLIALELGDISKAVEHLDASTKVQAKCCHNITRGFPTVLASKVLDKGKPVPVVRFCETFGASGFHSGPRLSQSTYGEGEVGTAKDHEAMSVENNVLSSRKNGLAINSHRIFETTVRRLTRWCVEGVRLVRFLDFNLVPVRLSCSPEPLNGFVEEDTVRHLMRCSGGRGCSSTIRRGNGHPRRSPRREH